MTSLLGTRNNHDASTNGMVRVGMPTGASRVFKAPCTNTVKITLGPKGRNVVLEKKFGAPLITNDTLIKYNNLYLNLNYYSIMNYIFQGTS